MWWKNQLPRSSCKRALIELVEYMGGAVVEYVGGAVVEYVAQRLSFEL